MTSHELMILGRTIEYDGTVGNPCGLPIDVLNRHLLITGATGAGKTTTGTTALTTAHQQTGGATIVIDPKSGNWPTEIARALYKTAGSLTDLHYFDSTTLPAFSMFDIRRDLAADVDRLRAIQDIRNHFLEILTNVRVTTESAIRAPDVIAYLITALFDPVHGDESFTIATLFEAIQQLRKHRQFPEVAPEWSEQLLTSLAEIETQSFQKIADGASTRVEKIYGDGYLRPIFNTVPTEPHDAFAFDDVVNDSDAVLIFDVSGNDTKQRILSNLILSELWRALRRRLERQSGTPQTLLFIDEVPQLGIETHLKQLLAMGREFGIGVVPMLQYPSQLNTTGETAQPVGPADTKAEILNNIHSVLAGRIPTPDGIEQKLARRQQTPTDIERTLRNVPDNRWVWQPATPRSATPSPTHQIADPPLPPGHPDGDAPFTTAEQEAFTDALTSCRERTAANLGRSYDEYTADAFITSPLATKSDDALHDTYKQTNYATTLPLVNELPDPVEYDSETSSVVCSECGQRRRASFDALVDTFRCHGSLAAVDRAAIPPVTLGLTMTETEIEAAPVSLRTLCGLQVIANIGKHTYHPLEVDLVHDKLSAVLNRLGITSQDISALSDAGLITVDHLGHYAYYTLTPDGRDLLGESYRHGIDWGPGKRDLAGSLLHQTMVEALRRYIEITHAENPDSPVTETEIYYTPNIQDLGSDVDDEIIYDVVGLTADGVIHVVGEAERNNHDVATAALDDYYAMAAADPADALWVTPSDQKGHDAVIKPLDDPSSTTAYPDPDPVIDGQSEATNLKHHNYDQPGLTGIYKLTDIRNELSPPTTDDYA
mgnify:CR=1 FL=1